mmetsp:Transcript_1334/g.2932  ORF Transcript_1334/g.2932 Transcript_1334/m.2932 type:complete len:372 (-) Transcript_1334:28-1143(-)
MYRSLLSLVAVSSSRAFCFPNPRVGCVSSSCSSSIMKHQRQQQQQQQQQLDDSHHSEAEPKEAAGNIHHDASIVHQHQHHHHHHSRPNTRTSSSWNGMANRFAETATTTTTTTSMRLPRRTTRASSSSHDADTKQAEDYMGDSFGGNNSCSSENEMESDTEEEEEEESYSTATQATRKRHASSATTPCTTTNTSSTTTTTTTTTTATATKKKRVRIRQTYVPETLEYVDAYNDLDVLCQRGGLANKHPGNIRYHRHKAALQGLYKATPKAHKGQVAQQLVNQVHEWGGRFLEKETTTNAEGVIVQERWYEIHHKKACIKAGQALRENYSKEERAAKRARFRRKTKKMHQRQLDAPDDQEDVNNEDEDCSEL